VFLNSRYLFCQFFEKHARKSRNNICSTYNSVWTRCSITKERIKNEIRVGCNQKTYSSIPVFYRNTHSTKTCHPRAYLLLRTRTCVYVWARPRMCTPIYTHTIYTHTRTIDAYFSDVCVYNMYVYNIPYTFITHRTRELI